MRGEGGTERGEECGAEAEDGGRGLAAEDEVTEISEN